MQRKVRKEYKILRPNPLRPLRSLCVHRGLAFSFFVILNSLLEGVKKLKKRNTCSHKGTKNTKKRL
jgi:hypothetical protein